MIKGEGPCCWPAGEYLEFGGKKLFLIGLLAQETLAQTTLQKNGWGGVRFSREE